MLVGEPEPKARACGENTSYRKCFPPTLSNDSAYFVGCKFDQFLIVKKATPCVSGDCWWDPGVAGRGLWHLAAPVNPSPFSTFPISSLPVIDPSFFVAARHQRRVASEVTSERWWRRRHWSRGDTKYQYKAHNLDLLSHTLDVIEDKDLKSILKPCFRKYFHCWFWRSLSASDDYFLALYIVFQEFLSNKWSVCCSRWFLKSVTLPSASQEPLICHHHNCRQQHHYCHRYHPPPVRSLPLSWLHHLRC